MNKIGFENSIKLPDNVQVDEIQWQRILLKLNKYYYEVREILRESADISEMEWRNTLNHHDVCTRVEIGTNYEEISI